MGLPWFVTAYQRSIFCQERISYAEWARAGSAPSGN
jgi:hypothetical protein